MAAAPILPASPAPTPAPAPLSEAARIIDTFIAPSKTFTDLRRNASWWAPFLLVAIVWVGFVYTVEKKIGYRKITEDQIQMVPKAAAQSRENDAGTARTAICGTHERYYLFRLRKGSPPGHLVRHHRSATVRDFQVRGGHRGLVQAFLRDCCLCQSTDGHQLLLGTASLLAGVSPDGYTPDNPIASNPAIS